MLNGRSNQAPYKRVLSELDAEHAELKQSVNRKEARRVLNPKKQTPKRDEIPHLIAIGSGSRQFARLGWPALPQRDAVRPFDHSPTRHVVGSARRYRPLLGLGYPYGGHPGEPQEEEIEAEENRQARRRPEAFNEDTDQIVGDVADDHEHEINDDQPHGSLWRIPAMLSPGTGTPSTRRGNKEQACGALAHGRPHSMDCRLGEANDHEPNEHEHGSRSPMGVPRAGRGGDRRVGRTAAGRPAEAFRAGGSDAARRQRGELARAPGQVPARSSSEDLPPCTRDWMKLAGRTIVTATARDRGRSNRERCCGPPIFPRVSRRTLFE